MKYGIFAFALVFILTAVPVSAYELRDPGRDEPRLHIELESVPSRVQQDFDRYVKELAAAARQDATPEGRARLEDAARERRLAVLNPIALLRW
jgi:hypothetical protein